MLRLSFYWSVVLYSILLTSAQAENLTQGLMDGETFYSHYPSQAPLAEQFSAIVNSPPVPIRIVQDKPLRIAVLLFEPVNSIESRALLRSFRQRMREIGIEYRLDTYVEEGQGSEFESYFKIQEAQPDYLIMTKMGFIQRRFLERFLPSNRTKVIVYNFASPISYWLDSPPLMYVGFDQQQAVKTLVSFLERNLSKDAPISAFILPDSYLGRVRCDLFLDEMERHGRSIHQILVVEDDRDEAAELARKVLRTQKVGFIFSCSQAISNGVVDAVKVVFQATNQPPAVQTNAWNLSFRSIDDLTAGPTKVNVLFMKDALSIAVAEAIKLDLEGRNMPRLYMARFTFVTSDLDSGSLQLVIEETYPYSVDLWQK